MVCVAWGMYSPQQLSVFNKHISPHPPKKLLVGSLLRSSLIEHGAGWWCRGAGGEGRCRVGAFEGTGAHGGEFAPE